LDDDDPFFLVKRLVVFFQWLQHSSFNKISGFNR
jgi:hypothetical protein